MRLTRETLLKIAHDTADQRVRVSRRIVCIYLTGSLLDENPLLGGTTDIDLVIIHDSDPLQEREIVRLTDDVHLDISHYAQSVFHHPRHLRTDPWLGPFIYSKPMVFHDTNHWFDFTQAATGAQFFQPDNIVQRASSLAQSARQAWMDLEVNRGASHPSRVLTYLHALENAGNALVSLTGEGKPLAERRFILQLPQRLQELKNPDLVSGLTGLLVSQSSALEGAWIEWQQHWQSAFAAAGQLPELSPRLDPARQFYYQRGAAALWEQNPDAAVWLLMRTWTLAVNQLPEPSPVLEQWGAAVKTLGLEGKDFLNRVEELDQYLDRVEETIDQWGQANGVTNVQNV